MRVGGVGGLDGSEEVERSGKLYDSMSGRANLRRFLRIGDTPLVCVDISNINLGSAFSAAHLLQPTSPAIILPCKPSDVILQRGDPSTSVLDEAREIDNIYSSFLDLLEFLVDALVGKLEFLTEACDL